VPEAENLFVASAHYRNGILLAPLTADVLAADILNRTASNRIEAFSPRRFRLANAG
jgi:glycine oxidase